MGWAYRGIQGQHGGGGGGHRGKPSKPRRALGGGQFLAQQRAKTGSPGGARSGGEPHPGPSAKSGEEHPPPPAAKPSKEWRGNTHRNLRQEWRGTNHSTHQPHLHQHQQQPEPRKWNCPLLGAMDNPIGETGSNGNWAQGQRRHTCHKGQARGLENGGGASPFGLGWVALLQG